MMIHKDVTPQMVNIVQAQIEGDSLKAAQQMNEHSAKAAEKEIKLKAKKEFWAEKWLDSHAQLEESSETQCKH